MVDTIEDAKTLRAIPEMKEGKGRPAEVFFAELAKEFGFKTTRKK